LAVKCAQNAFVTELTHGHLVFASGATLVAVSAQYAAEIVALPIVTRVPGAAAHIEGVFAHRGEVIPVVAFERLLGLASSSTSSRVVLLRLKQGSMGITASKVFGISRIDGTMQRLSESGVKSYLYGPLKADAGEVLHIDAPGLFDYLAGGGL
jgi:purine-binding chemotaxis protein CheW